MKRPDWIRATIFAVALLPALVVGAVAQTRQTIDQLGSGAALSGSEKIPMFQGSSPAVTTTPSMLQAFMAMQLAGTGLAASGNKLNLQPAQPSALGGVQSLTCPVAQWINTINTSGVPNCGGLSGTAGGDLTGTYPNPVVANNAVTNAKAAQMAANTYKGNPTGSTANASDAAWPSCPDSGGNHLNYVNGSGVSCGTSSGGAGMTLLNTLTASNSASLSDTTSFTNAYSNYLIIIEDMTFSASISALNLQYHSGGSFQASSYSARLTTVDNTGGFVNASVGGAAIPLIGTTTTNGANLSLVAELRLFNPAGGSNYKHVHGQISGFDAATTMWSTSFMFGTWIGGGAVDGIQIAPNTGNIVTGTVKIYGIP